MRRLDSGCLATEDELAEGEHHKEVRVTKKKTSDIIKKQRLRLLLNKPDDSIKSGKDNDDEGNKEPSDTNPTPKLASSFVHKPKNYMQMFNELMANIDDKPKRMIPGLAPRISPFRRKACTESTSTLPIRLPRSNFS